MISPARIAPSNTNMPPNQYIITMMTFIISETNGKLSDISRMAQEAVKAAHISGGVPNLEVRVPQRDEAGFAWLVCFFELACAISGYMSGVNPFDQPGVEAYKKNMFSLLGKPEAN